MKSRSASPTPATVSAMARSPMSARARVHDSLQVPWRAAGWGAALGSVAAALWCLPAPWLAAAVASASHGRFQLTQAEGSVWTGSAVLMLTGGEGSRDATALPGRLRWRLRPAWVDGGPGAHLQVQQDSATTEPVQLALSWGLGRWQCQVGTGAGPTALGTWPVAWLSGLGTPFNTLALQGRMRIHAQSLQLHLVQGRWLWSGQAWAEVDHLSSRLSPLTLGSYRLDMVGGAQPQAPTLRLSTREGALQLSGSGHWGSGRLRFDGQAQAAPDAQAAMNPLLNLIGRRDGARSIISIG